MEEAFTQFLPPFLANLDPTLLLLIILLTTIWSLVWKGFALWYAAKSHQPGWFVLLLICNTLGILEIAYLLLFAKISPLKRQVPVKSIETNGE